MGNKASHSSMATIKSCVEGRTVLITGANSGLGYATAQRYAKLGAKVICGTRTDAKGIETVSRIQEASQNANVFHVAMDLNDLNQVKLAAEKVQSDHGELHHLINNAGFGMWKPEDIVRQLDPSSVQNIETHFQVNYLSHFYLTQLLLPLMASSVTEQAQSRITNVTTKAHYFIQDASVFNSEIPENASDFYSAILTPGGTDGTTRDRNTLPPILLSNVHSNSLPRGALESPLSPENTILVKSYATHSYTFAKLAQILFTVGLQRALDVMKSPIAVNAIHPGAAMTGFYSHFENPQAVEWLKKLRIMKSAEDISRYILWANADPTLNEHKGEYFSQTKMTKPSPVAQNEDLIEHVWKVSEQLIEQRVQHLSPTTTSNNSNNNDSNTEEEAEEEAPVVVEDNKKE